MESQQPSVVFFGTGPVAAEALKLLTKYVHVEAVITKPKPPFHKGAFPVLSVAQSLGLPIEEVGSKKMLTALLTDRRFVSRIGILIDFGIIVEKTAIDTFELGIINSHFSLLPQWRGPDPITFSILSGQSKTGVSLMLLVEAMDEGPLLAIAEYDIKPQTTTPQLTEALIALSNGLLKETIPKYITRAIKSAPQEKVAQAVGYSDIPSYSKKLVKEDGVIDWSKTATQIEQEIRAYIQWPKSRTIIGEYPVIITCATAEDGEGTPGQLWRTNKRLGVYTGNGILMIERLRPANKSDMSIGEFLNGYGKRIS